MDEELKELLKELNSVVKDLLNDDKVKPNNSLKKIFDRAFKQKAIISMEKREDGTAETHIEGSTLGILISLVGLEKSVLEKLKVPTKVFNDIKNIVGVEEQKEYE